MSIITILRRSIYRTYEYFSFKQENTLRIIMSCINIIVLPAVSIGSTIALLEYNKKNEAESDEGVGINNGSVLIFSAMQALVLGVGTAGSLYISNSVLKVARQKYVEKLLDKEHKALANINLSNIPALQYIIVGVGIRDYTIHTINLFNTLPVQVINIASVLTIIGLYTGLETVGVTCGFLAASNLVLYYSSKFTSISLSNNQKIENALVALITNIEKNKNEISGSGFEEYEKLILYDNISHHIPNNNKLFLCDLIRESSFNFLIFLCPRFLGGYYTNNSINHLEPTTHAILNSLFLSLLKNINILSNILTNSYKYIKLNDEKLQLFDKAYEEFLLLHKQCKNIQLVYKGEDILLTNLCIMDYGDCNSSNNGILYKDLTITLHTNTIYKVIGDNYYKRQALLHTIIDNKCHCNGHIVLPEFAKDNLFIITTKNYLPKGSLLDTMVSKNISYFECDSNNNKDMLEDLKYKIVNLLIIFGLIPNSITEEALTCYDSDWNNLLNENEKTIIAITKALISPTPFIVMCGITSNMRIKSSQYKLLDILRTQLSSKKQFALIYTEADISNLDVEQIPSDKQLSFVEEVVECIGQDSNIIG